MGWVQDKKDAVIDKMMDKHDFTTDEKEKTKSRAQKVENFVWTIAKFIFLMYLFNKLYSKIGFDKTIIIMMVTIIISLRSNLRLLNQKIGDR